MTASTITFALAMAGPSCLLALYVAFCVARDWADTPADSRRAGVMFTGLIMVAAAVMVALAYQVAS